MEARTFGNQLGEYYLREKIGQGGFSEVWKGEHHFLEGKWVALKILREGISPSLLKREAKLQHRLSLLAKQEGLTPDGVVEILGGDLEATPPYLVLEYIPPCEGMTSLRDWLQNKGAFPPDQGLDLFLRIVRILDLAHRQGIVHGDLKPENIFFTPEGGVKVGDFGLANLLETEEGMLASFGESQLGQMRGTIAYMAPEQQKGEKASFASDVYALGLLLFEILVGRLPEGGESLKEHLEHPEVEKIDSLFLKCYTHRETRFPSAEALWKKARTLWPERWQRLKQLIPQKEGKLSLTLQNKKEEKKTPSKEVKKKYAGFGKRFAAACIDGITFLSLFFTLFPRAQHDHPVALGVLALLYFVFPLAIWGGTLGKLALGLRVTNRQGEKPTLPQALFRLVGYGISVIFLGFGFYLISLHPEKRALHDLLAGTFVVEENSSVS